MNLYVFVAIFCVLFGVSSPQKGINISKIEISPLIRNTSKILCTFRAKTLYVYLDKQTSNGVPSHILRTLNACGVSYISMRSRGAKSPLPAVKDDGIRMYLLMVLHRVSEFIEISIIKKSSAAKHLSHVLIVIEDSSAITETWLQQTFRQFWLKWFPNVAILYSTDDRLQVYRYNPFAQNILVKVTPKGSLPRIEELFPRRLPNMERRPLRICLYNDDIRAIFQPDGRITGTDGLMTKFIVQRLNATQLVNRVSTDGYENKTADLCFREILSAQDDIALNIRFLSLPVFYKRVESTVVHSRDDLCILVPKAKIASTFWNLFRAYSIAVWCCILISMLLAYCFFRYTLRENGDFRQGLLLQLYAASLTLPFMHPPRKFPLRFFLFCWLFYGLLISGAFKGTLTSNLVFRTFLPDIDTLRDFAVSRNKLALIPRHMKHLHRFLNLTNPFEAMIAQKLVVLPDKQFKKNIESNNLSYSYLLKNHVAIFQQSSRRHMHKGRPLYHVMETCLVPFHAVYILPYGSPYLGAINSLIRSSSEFGFVTHWERLMKAAFKKSGKANVPKGRNDGDPVVLTLPHFEAAFCLWAVGLLLAFCLFLWEKFGQKTSQSSCSNGTDMGTRKARITKKLKRMQTHRKSPEENKKSRLKCKSISVKVF